MDINVSYSAELSVNTNWLIIAIYQSTALGTVVASQGYQGSTSGNVSFTDLQPTPYYVYFWENTTNTPGGTLRFKFLYDPSYQNAVVRADLFLTMGITSGLNAGTAGTAGGSYVDPTNSLASWTYTLERRATGSLIPTTEYTLDTNNNWFLTNPQDIIQAEEVFVLHFQPQITVVTPSGGNSAVVQFGGGFNLITADISLNATAATKMNMIQGAGPIVNVTLPDPSTVPDCQLVPFMSNGGSHLAANIIAGTGSIYFINQTLSQITLCQSESIVLYVFGGNWYVFTSDTNYRLVGMFVDSFQKAFFNMLFCDGTQGLLRAQYPRLWSWISLLDASALVSPTQWANQDEASGLYLFKGCFNYGDGSTTFGLPLLYNNSDHTTPAKFMPGYLRAVDGVNRKAGSYQTDRVGNFQAQLSGPQVRVKYSTDNSLIPIANGPNQPLPTLPITTTIPLTPFAGYQPATGTTTPNAQNFETSPANIGVYKGILF